MGLPEQKPHRRGVHALLAQVARGKEVAEPFRHLAAADVEELAVQPPARERLPRRRLRLRDLVLMMRKDQIHPPAWMSSVSTPNRWRIACSDIAEHSRCQPGRPRPKGAS